MAKKHRPRADRPTPKPRPGEIAQAQGHTLNSYRLGALPMLQAILQRLRLEEFLGVLPERARPAFEFRHASWFDDETYSALREGGAGTRTPRVRRAATRREKRAGPPR